MARDVEEGCYLTGMAATPLPAQRRYRTSIDELYAAGIAAASEDGPGPCAAEQDFLLANARRGIGLAVAAASEHGKCRYCWMPRTRCFCAAMSPLGECCPGIEWVLLQHPQEFLRSTSSGKLVSELLGGKFIVYGGEGHKQRLAEVLSDIRTHILLPSPVSKTVADVAATATGREAVGLPNGAPLIVLVLDGSWEHVRALQQAVEQLQPSVPCIRLNNHAVQKHESALINCLKPGAGRDRLSTFEACALLLAEAEELGVWGVRPGTSEAALRAMHPMVEAVACELEAMAPLDFAEGSVQRRGWRHSGDVEMEHWITALQGAARTAPVRVGLKRCCVCGAVVSSPLRMRDHLEGRRHCLVVAELHLGRRHGHTVPHPDDGMPDITEASAAEVFHEHSTLRLFRCIPEPPDVALVKLCAR